MALVDYIRYERYLGKAQWEANYGAVVIRRGTQPVFIRCGTAGLIEESVKGLPECHRANRHRPSLDEPLIQDHSRALDKTSSRRSTCTWRASRTCIVCPDGALNFLASHLAGRRGAFPCKEADHFLRGQGSCRPNFEERTARQK